MSKGPIGNTTGIFGMFFREFGEFWEQVYDWAEERTVEDREDTHRDLDRRRIEAEAKLLEQARLAREAGLDVDAILAKSREDSSMQSPVQPVDAPAPMARRVRIR